MRIIETCYSGLLCIKTDSCSLLSVYISVYIVISSCSNTFGHLLKAALNLMII